LEELEDGVLFTFDIDGLDNSDIVFSKTKEQQLRFLINCADLAKLHNEYNFSLSTDNIMTDMNLRPWVLLRDAQSGGGHYSSTNNILQDHTNLNSDSSNGDSTRNGIGTGNGGQAFLSKYKSLIGNILLPKYSYDDFQKGGEDLFKKHKLLLELSEMESVSDIKVRLTKEYQTIVKEKEQTEISVPKRNVLTSRIAIPLLGVALLTASFFTLMAFWNDIPYRNQVIMANEAYIAGNPLEVQQALSGFGVNELSHKTRHILSRAYVSTEPLSEAQRSNIMMGLTLMADTTIFDYWIHLGRLEFYEAIDIAQRFGDNELLLFAYLRQEAAVRVDPSLTGAEMVETLNYIENRINALQRDRDGAVDLLAGEGDSEEDGDEHYHLGEGYGMGYGDGYSYAGNAYADVDGEDPDEDESNENDDGE